MKSVNDLNFKSKVSTKNKAKVFIILTLVCTTVFLGTLLIYDSYENEWTEGGVEDIEHRPLASEPIIEKLNNATPSMATADSIHNWNDIEAHDADETIDGDYYFDWQTFDDMDEHMGWWGDQEDTEWNLKWYLGGARDVENIRFQFGDLYTWNGLLGVKHFQYDVEVLKNTWDAQEGKYVREWVTIAENVQNQDPDDETWDDVLYSATGDTSTNLINPRGTVYDPFKNNRYVVADGTDNELKVFDSSGNYITDIYADDTLHGHDWKASNTVIADVACLPAKDGLFQDWEGGYVIATQNGGLYHAEYTKTRLDRNDYLIEIGGEFVEIDSIATNAWPTYNYNNRGSFDMYVLEKTGSSNFGLYHWRTGVSSLGMPFMDWRSNHDDYLSINYPASSVEVLGDYDSNQIVCVLREDTDEIYMYSLDLGTYLGKVSYGWGNIADISKLDFHLAAVSSTTDKVYAIDPDSREVTGDINIEHHGAAPTHITSNQFDKYVTIAGGDNAQARITTGMGYGIVKGDMKYFDWENYEIPFADQISAYGVRIHDFNEVSWDPLQVEFYTPDNPYYYYGWRKPILLETMYDWQYYSDIDGVDMEILSPVDNENFVSTGIDGEFDVHLDISVRPTTHWKALQPMPPMPWDFYLDVDTLQYSIDNGSYINFPTGFKEEKSIYLSGSVGKEVVTFEKNFPASDIYTFKLGYSKAHAQDGDVWDVYVNDEYLLTYDEQTTAKLYEDYWSVPYEPDDLFSDFFSRGIYTIRFEWVSGSSKTLPSIDVFYNEYKATGIGMSEGRHNMTVYVNDTMGWEDTDFVKFNVWTYPDINIIEPTEAMAINTDVFLKWVTTDNNLDTGIVNLNDEFYDMVTYAENGTGTSISYEKNITVDEFIPNDWNQIQIMVNDTLGQNSFAYRTFFLDFIPPRINFPGMNNNSMIPMNSIYNINVTDETLTEAYYTINGKTKHDLPENGLNVVDIPDAEFDEGWNIIEVYAEDYVGNTATAYLNLSKDQSAPIINVTTPIHDQKYFKEGGVTDVIPLNITAYDTIINRSADPEDGIIQPQIDDYIRLHANSYPFFTQGIVAESECITDLRMPIRGLGRLRVTLWDNHLLMGDPISIGYLDVDDQVHFKWYTVDMADTRTVTGQTYYIEVRSLTLYNDVSIGIGNNPYDGGMIRLGGIPRPHWDLTFIWQYKEIVPSSDPTETWFNINGDYGIAPVTNGSIRVENLTDVYTFEHGWNYINVFCEDENGYKAEKTIPIQFIDTGASTPIEVDLKSQLDNEWVLGNISVRWAANVPDYVDRVNRENYTHDIYLLATNGTYFHARTVVDRNQVEINTTIVSDGFYYVFINSTDGTTWDNSTSAVIRILNGKPIINIEEPENGDYVVPSDGIKMTVICADITRVAYAIDEGWNITITEFETFDFFFGYTFSFRFNETDIDEGAHEIFTYIENGRNGTAQDSVIVLLDLSTSIEINDIGTQADIGGIIIEYSAPYDASVVTMVVKNETDVYQTVIFTEAGENITGQYVFRESLPLGTYEIEITVEDRAGNVATDSVSFLVTQSTYADILDTIVEFVAGILGFIMSILGFLMIAFVRKAKKEKKASIDACSLGSADTCSI